MKAVQAPIRAVKHIYRSITARLVAIMIALVLPLNIWGIFTVSQLQRYLYSESRNSIYSVGQLTMTNLDNRMKAADTFLFDTLLKGAPDMVVEILSPSTRRHDRLTKFNLYQRAGVREYWLVDPVDKSVQVFVLEDGRYSARDFGAAGDRLRVNVLDDCVIDLSEVFPE